MVLPILYFKVSQVEIFIFCISISANSTDPVTILHYVAFQMGLHCLPKYLVACIYVQNDYRIKKENPGAMALGIGSVYYRQIYAY